MVTLHDIHDARALLGSRLHRTPVLTATTLGAMAGVELLVKAELLQRTGSFKPRGVLTKLAHLTPEERARGVIGISAGNHAQALAYGAAREGIACTVVMPATAVASKVAATRGYGAEVVLHGATTIEAFAEYDRLRTARRLVAVHPFDDPYVIAGQGTVGLEILEDVPDVDTIVVPVGGGGLISGIAVAAAGRARIVGVEPEGSTALHSALEAGERVELTPTSIPDGLNAPHAGTNALAIVRELTDGVVLVSEEEIAHGFRFLYERAKLACEPAGAAAVAAVLAGEGEAGPTVCVVSGGNVALETAAAILASR